MSTQSKVQVLLRTVCVHCRDHLDVKTVTTTQPLHVPINHDIPIELCKQEKKPHSIFNSILTPIPEHQHPFDY